jgi:hypothetical protein
MGWRTDTHGCLEVEQNVVAERFRDRELLSFLSKVSSRQVPMSARSCSSLMCCAAEGYRGWTSSPWCQAKA